MTTKAKPLPSKNRQKRTPYKIAFICSIIAGIAYLLFLPWWLWIIGIWTGMPTNGPIWGVGGTVQMTFFFIIAGICELVKNVAAFVRMSSPKDILIILIPTVIVLAYLSFVVCCHYNYRRPSYDLFWGGIAIYYIATAILFRCRIPPSKRKYIWQKH